MKELSESLSEVEKLAVGLGTLLLILVVFRVFSWAVDKLND